MWVGTRYSLKHILNQHFVVSCGQCITTNANVEMKCDVSYGKNKNQVNVSLTAMHKGHTYKVKRKMFKLPVRLDLIIQCAENQLMCYDSANNPLWISSIILVHCC
jgi:hypothetical protein